MMKMVLDQLVLAPGQGLKELEALGRKKLGAGARLDRVLRRSVDARKKDRVVVVYKARFLVGEAQKAQALKAGATVWVEEPEEVLTPAVNKNLNVVIVGAGPAGLFAALRLSQRGLKPVIVEQGKRVEDRHRDILVLREAGVLDPYSNIVFGEGGAGTYSDGKLTTRIHKEGIPWVFDQLVAHGAQEEILYDAKPHVGTDVLSVVVARIRQTLEDRGCEIHFGQRVVEILRQGDRAAGVRTAQGREFLGDRVILAPGHSARELYGLLNDQGVSLAPKSLAVGVRIEHPRSFIDQAQYGAQAAKLPAADYRLTYVDPVSSRGIYSFCMCPGGEVVNSSSESGRLCVNGMSYAARDLEFSNAALVVTVDPADWGGAVLGGLEFQRSLEARAFEAGGGGFASPAQGARDFLEGRISGELRGSYEPRMTAGDFKEILGPMLAHELVQGLRVFDRKIPGFVDEGVLVGVETRTSSPVRILRGEDFQSVGLPGLYPVGEGAGYAGGIVSSAVDGVRAADQIAMEGP